MENGLRKELKLSGMIAMAAGGMIAAWMVEISVGQARYFP